MRVGEWAWALVARVEIEDLGCEVDIVAIDADGGGQEGGEFAGRWTYYGAAALVCEV